jgi:hypothetical protein
MRLAMIAATTLLFSAPTLAADVAPNEALKHMSFLAGSCWEGPFPDGKSTDVHCYKWIQGGRYLREQNTLRGVTPPYSGETTYYWDHQTKTVRYVYWSNAGGYSTGSSVFENGVFTYPNEKYVGPEGEINVRAEMRQIDADSYSLKSEMQDKNGNWVQMQNATYTRAPLNW